MLAQTVALPCSNAESTRVISGSHLCHHTSVATNTRPWTIPIERQSYPNVTPILSPFWTRLAANICPSLKSAATPHRTPRPYCVKCCDALKGHINEHWYDYRKQHQQPKLYFDEHGLYHIKVHSKHTVTPHHFTSSQHIKALSYRFAHTRRLITARHKKAACKQLQAAFELGSHYSIILLRVLLLLGCVDGVCGGNANRYPLGSNDPQSRFLSNHANRRVCP